MPRIVRRRVPHRLTIVVGLLTAAAFWRLADRSGGAGRQLPDLANPQRVKRVIDGDTLLLDSGFRVRLIGVDTPETKHPERPPEPWGAEASEFTRRMVEGRVVLIEYDLHRLDAYHRVLAYVSVDGRMLNEELIRAGLSACESGFPFRSDRLRRFRAAEKEARAAQAGNLVDPCALTIAPFR